MWNEDKNEISKSMINEIHNFIACFIDLESCLTQFSHLLQLFSKINQHKSPVVSAVNGLFTIINGAQK